MCQIHNLISCFEIRDLHFGANFTFSFISYFMDIKKEEDVFYAKLSMFSPVI